MAILFLVAGGAQLATAQSCVPLSGATYSQNFDSLPSSGTVLSANTLPTGFSFAEAGSSAGITYAADNGSNTSGNTYSYGATGSSERAFGELTSSTLQSTIGACFVNNSGSAIMTAVVGYTGEQWRLGDSAAPVDRLDFQYSTTATSLTTGTWLNFDALDFTTPNNSAGSVGALNGNAAANRTVFAPVAINFPAPIAPDKTLFIRWLPSNIAGANDALAIDDFLLGTIYEPGLSGDFNSNGVVDAGDYVIWRKKFGVGDLPNDAEISPGNVDAADYAHWRKRFGIVESLGAGNSLDSNLVPEPASNCCLLFVNCCLIMRLRRRRQNAS